MLNKILEYVVYAIGGALAILVLVFGFKTIMQLHSINESK